MTLSNICLSRYIIDEENEEGGILQILTRYYTKFIY